MSTTPEIGTKVRLINEEFWVDFAPDFDLVGRTLTVETLDQPLVSEKSGVTPVTYKLLCMPGEFVARWDDGPTGPFGDHHMLLDEDEEGNYWERVVNNE